jgi:hypothetical protein
MTEPLNFDWESVHCQRVTAIEGTNLLVDEVARSRCGELALHLEQGVVVHVSVNVDTDEVIVRAYPDASALDSSLEWKTIDALKEYVGYELGWCWIARNYLGYADTFTLSFAGIEPEVTLVGMASSLYIYRLTRI